MTETCDPAYPRLITHIKTTLSTVQDCEVTTEIQQDLVEDDLKPDQHLVDAGYVDASNLAQSQHDLGIDLVGPTRPDTSWQAQETDGFDLTHLDIRWHQQQVICPAGHVNRAWIEGKSQFQTPVIRVHFPEKTCMKCALKVRCTREVNRSITLQPQREYEVLHWVKKSTEIISLLPLDQRHISVKAYAMRHGVHAIYRKDNAYVEVERILP